jgi:oxygen-independent coproporphyrinogen-3 oxidase
VDGSLCTIYSREVEVDLKSNIIKNGLEELLNTPVYSAYSYSYPHKTAYRPLSVKEDLIPIWQKENLENLFLYVHIPFCTMRCGFCNLFTIARPQDGVAELYLDALSRQINALSPLLMVAKFARYAIGGGTPTYLSVKQLERLFDLTNFKGMQANTPIGIESSPETITRDKIALLHERNVSRISMGVQSFSEYEIKSLARMQSNHSVANAVDIIRTNSNADLNLDLIYGLAGQSEESWIYSLKETVRFQPEEIYLYPLYVREQTGLGKKQANGAEIIQIEESRMLKLYRLGREFLLNEGYKQVSMRMFRKKSALEKELPVYSCQDDGMIGLGAGARSYTEKLHYSSEFSVGRKGVSAIIEDYIEKSESDFRYADYGVYLNKDEKKRRFIMQSLLIADGLNIERYFQKFGTNCLDEFPQINVLIEAKLAEHTDCIRLSSAGLERADSIGPWFVSDKVKKAMSQFELA